MIQMSVDGDARIRRRVGQCCRQFVFFPVGAAPGEAEQMRSVPVLLRVGMLSGMLLLSACSSIGGGRADRDFKPGFYAGAGLLVSQLEPDTDNVVGTSVDESMSGGGAMSLGYDINSRFSIEGHVAALGEASLDPRGAIGYTVGGLSAIAYGLGQPRDRALREGFSLFGRLGVGLMENDASGVGFTRVNDAHLLAGLGLEYGLSNGLGLRAELVAHETDAKYAQLGLIYRFGRSAGGSRPSEPIVDRPVVNPQVVDIPLEGELASELPPVPAAAPVPEPQVPQTTLATRPTVEDNDADGVLNAADACPDSAPGAPVKNDGCAIFGGVVEGVNFQPGSDRLTSEANEVLDEVAQTLQEYPDIRLIIEAHTDNEGPAAVNLQLSKRRAIAVARYLIDAGISGSRLKPQAYGESRPRTSNMTALGRAANRRVEFAILQ